MRWRRRIASTDSEGWTASLLRAGRRGARGPSSAALPSDPAGTPPSYLTPELAADILAFFGAEGMERALRPSDQTQRVHLVAMEIDRAIRKQETDPAA